MPSIHHVDVHQVIPLAERHEGDFWTRPGYIQNIHRRNSLQPQVLQSVYSEENVLGGGFQHYVYKISSSCLNIALGSNRPNRFL